MCNAITGEPVARYQVRLIGRLHQILWDRCSRNLGILFFSNRYAPWFDILQHRNGKEKLRKKSERHQRFPRCNPASLFSFSGARELASRSVSKSQRLADRSEEKRKKVRPEWKNLLGKHIRADIRMSFSSQPQ